MQSATTVDTASQISAWAWLFPATYVLHLGEEYWGGEGFPAWIARVAGAQFSERDFLTLNALALVLMCIGVFLLRHKTWRWLLVSLSGVVLLNGLLHLVASLITWSYSPGLISGVLVWGPLGTITLWQQWQAMPHKTFGIGLLIAFGLHGIALLLALLA